MTTVFALSATFGFLLLTGCVTEFMGDAYVSRDKCEKWCKDVGLECTGMMALGEYTSGCICTKPNTTKITEAAAQAAAGSVAAVISAKRHRETLAAITAGSLPRVR